MTLGSSPILIKTNLLRVLFQWEVQWSRSGGNTKRHAPCTKAISSLAQIPLNVHGANLEAMESADLTLLLRIMPSWVSYLVLHLGTSLTSQEVKTEFRPLLRSQLLLNMHTGRLGGMDKNTHIHSLLMQCHFKDKE